MLPLSFYLRQCLSVRSRSTRPDGKEPWEKVDYYVCEGVTNGVA
eukprot:SAG22_NODE_987_length_6142_cov_3.152242_1_plen_43_part_10